MNGHIGITLQLAEGRVVAVHITPRGAEGLAAAFAGMAASDVPGRVGMVFSLCGRAQAIASTAAIEDALGLAPAPGMQAARDVLRLAEMFTQVAMRLALHWPRALDLVPNPAPVRTALQTEKALEAALMDAGWRRPGAGMTAPDIAAASALVDGLEAAAAALPAAPLRAGIEGLEGFGALPDGVPPEQTALARHWAAPEVARLRARHGPALAARLQASLTDLATLPAEIRAALARVAPAAPQDPLRDTGQGQATAMTARGPLTHQVTVANGQITTYVIDAPTEANFRPGGPVEAGLLGAPAKDLAHAARLHVLAIDPCVEFNLEVRDA